MLYTSSWSVEGNDFFVYVLINNQTMRDKKSVNGLFVQRENQVLANEGTDLAYGCLNCHGASQKSPILNTVAKGVIYLT